MPRPRRRRRHRRRCGARSDHRTSLLHHRRLQTGTVRIVTDPLPADIRQTFDPDGLLDHLTIVTITAPGDTAIANFGYTSTSDIPRTGSDTGIVLRLALLLMALGGALLIFGRRRRHTTTR